MKKFALLLVFIYSVAGNAQSVAGAGVVSGVVRDSYGEGLPDVEVTLSNEAMSLHLARVSTIDGMFEVAALPPAAGYRLSLKTKGSAQWQSEAFEVLVGRRVTFDVRLPDGAAPATAQAAMETEIDKNTAALSSTVARTGIDGLPIQERRWGEGLTALAPAVNIARHAGAIAVYGNPYSNAFLIDGLLSGNSYFKIDPGMAGRLSQDAFQGVETLSGSAPAEFGHALGGTVNAVTRHGTSYFHGALYDYFSNRGLTATDRYALGRKLFEKRHQAGFNLGGPVRAGKLFFFSNAELRDGHGQGLNHIANPLVAGPAAHCEATAAQCFVAANYVLQPQQNALLPQSDHWVTGVGKLDYRRSDRNAFTLEGSGIRARSPGSPYAAVAPNGGLLSKGDNRRNSYFGKFAWTASGPNAANELRLGMLQDRSADSAATNELAPADVSIYVAGVPLGAGAAHPNRIGEKRFQLVDNVRISSNTHTILIGFDGMKSYYSAESLANATYNYASLTAFAQDYSSSRLKSYSHFTQALGTPRRDFLVSEIGWYLQDAWQPKEWLRVTGGVRWFKPYPSQPTGVNTTYYNTGTIPSSNNNADPRIGVSMRLDDRTVFRSGFGLFHAPTPGVLYDALLLGSGYDQTGILMTPSQSGAPVFPNGIAATSIPTGTENVLFAASKLRNPHSRQTTFAVERNLGRATVSAAYLGVRGVQLWSAADRNLLAETTDVTYTVKDASGQTATTFTMPVWTARNDSTHAHVYEVANSGSSWYRALVLQGRTQLSRSFRVRGAYTWSRALDDTGGPLLGGAVPLSSSSGNQPLDRGLSAADQRHRAVIDWSWRPASARSGILRLLSSGWEISSVVTLASSQTATPWVLVDGEQFAGVTMAFPGSLNGSGGWTRAPFLPVGDLRSEPEYTVNARLSRMASLGERVKGILLFEAFNLFNTQYATGVNTLAYRASGGVLTPVPGLGDGIAAQGFPNGSNARRCHVSFRLTF